MNALILMQAWLVGMFGFCFVHPEAPIDVAPEDNPSSELEPDLIVTKRDLSHFLIANPTPADLLLVVEIADTSLGFDLTAEAGLYARAGMVDYWVIDVSGRRIIMHRRPGGEVLRRGCLSGGWLFGAAGFGRSESFGWRRFARSAVSPFPLGWDHSRYHAVVPTILSAAREGET